MLDSLTTRYLAARELDPAYQQQEDYIPTLCSVCEIEDKILRHLEGYIKRLLRARFPDADQEELLSEAHRDCVRALRRFLPEKGQLKNWLAVWALRAARRIAYPRKLQPLLEEVPTSLNYTHEIELRTLCTTAIESLPGEVRQTAELVFLQEMEEIEVAVLLELTLTRVRANLTVARRQLADTLNQGIL